MARVLWRRLPESNFKAMHGAASPGGKGGGQRHIELGVNSPSNDVAGLLGKGIGSVVSVPTEPGPSWPKSQITIRPNAARSGSPWRIADQKNHRHPAWTETVGFPTSYDGADPPVLLLFKIGGAYHVRWLTQKRFLALAPDLATRDRGVAVAPAALLVHFQLPTKSALEEFGKIASTQLEEKFDPTNLEDGRKRVLGEVVRRQGQRTFRKKLIEAYQGCCAITECALADVLQAAHISAYRGPETNRPDNGLLLRADVHTLFDLGLISINPDTLTVRVSQQVQAQEYRALDGKKLKAGNVVPSKAALQEHWSRATP